jgi:hypothetical protein
MRDRGDCGSRRVESEDARVRRRGRGKGGVGKDKGAQDNEGNNARSGWQRACTHRCVGRLAPAVEGELDLGHGEMLSDERKENRRLLGFTTTPHARRESDARQCRYDSSNGQGHTPTASLPVPASREGGRQNGTITSRHSAEEPRSLESSGPPQINLEADPTSDGD